MPRRRAVITGARGAGASAGGGMKLFDATDYGSFFSAST